MITLEDYMMGRDAAYPPSDEQLAAAKDIVEKLGSLEEAFGSPIVLTSGYRPPEINATVPGAKHADAHEKCMGADLRDLGKELSKWCLANLLVLETIGLWMEAPGSAQNHVHVQTYAPKSGRRVFIA